jgi:light-independent protochlorophyllide reductase subunit B
MKLTLWTYEGPPHVGAMRVATAMKGLHLRPPRPAGRHLRRPSVHDDRAAQSPPAGHLHHLSGQRPWRRHRDTCSNRRRPGAFDRFQPQAMIVGASCTAELIQDDPGGLASTRLACPAPWCRWTCQLQPARKTSARTKPSTRWSALWPCRCRAPKAITCNLLGATALGLPPPRRRDRDHPASGQMGIAVNVCAPLGATPGRPAPGMGQAHFNVLLYPETGEGAARLSGEAPAASPYTKTTPIGVARHPRFHRRGRRGSPACLAAVDETGLRQPWWSGSASTAPT